MILNSIKQLKVGDKIVIYTSGWSHTNSDNKEQLCLATFLGKASDHESTNIKLKLVAVLTGSVKHELIEYLWNPLNIDWELTDKFKHLSIEDTITACNLLSL